MSLDDNIRKTSFVSTKAVDKIVRIFTGTYQAADLITRAGSSATAYVYRIPHGLPRPVSCDVITSTDGGATWDLGIGKIAFSDSTYVYIFHGYLATGPVTYKVYCNWIDDFDDTDPLVETAVYNTNPIQFDSRLNYQKIFRQDVLGFTAGTLGSTLTQTVFHNLGYNPNVKVYFEALPGEVWPLNIGGAQNAYLYDGAQDECQSDIYDNRLEVTMYRYSNVAKRAWYRIYYDSDTTG